jgi:hypothetical protein
MPQGVNYIANQAHTGSILLGDGKTDTDPIYMGVCVYIYIYIYRMIKKSLCT